MLPFSACFGFIPGIGKLLFLVFIVLLFAFILCVNIANGGANANAS